MFVYPKRYDVIVVGAGHAGLEAALASARIGCETLLLTLNVDAIGQMSCNPAIGGLAKGHLAREIDALGGEMGKAADFSGIQFRMLNKTKGRAVWAPRVQCDKKAYQLRQKWICESQINLDIKQGQSSRILHKNSVAYGLETTHGIQFIGKTIVITTGTFLRGLMHIGSNQQPGGRAGDGAAVNLSASLQEIGLELGRLKTGTPPRILRKSINFNKTEPQFGDEPIPFFSFWKDDLFHVEHLNLSSHNCKYTKKSVLERIGGQLPCHITYTTKKTHEIIHKNLHRSPMYGGVIDGIGPRYCPSIEDKVVRFSEKDRHQIFLEPEGFETDEFYINGLSTSLPFDVQIEIVKSLIGCENAEIMRPGYAVEYDFAFPTQLYASLETKVCKNLFLAGQINGTSGYEEAAAQGLIAGINAAMKILEGQPLILRRDQAYIGVLIDDLVTKGTSEPYRMFTSRAEYRLLLRQDNADLRLSKIGYDIGLLSKRNFDNFRIKSELIINEVNRLYSTTYNNSSLAKILSRPEASYHDLPGIKPPIAQESVEQIEIIIKYAGYVERQECDVSKTKKLEEKLIPKYFDYSKVPSLRTEARQKLAKIQPETLGQASRISGVSPADISILIIWLKRIGTYSSKNEDLKKDNSNLTKDKDCEL